MMLKNYYKPTPPRLRKIGDALLAASTTATTFSILNDLKYLAIACLVIGCIGKFLSNLFTEP